MRITSRSFSILAVLIAAFGLFTFSYAYFSSEDRTKAEGRLSLYKSTVIDELERFSHLPFVLARDPFVIETAQGADAATLDSRLANFANKAGLDAIFLMDLDGETIAASNANQPNSFVGQNYGFRPYFQTARNGTQGNFYGIGATTGLPGFFIADPVFDSNSEILGVVAIKVDLSSFEENWRQSGESVLLANEDGVVLLSSEPSWRYRALQPLSDEQKTTIHAARQFSNQPLEALDWSNTGQGRATIGGSDWIHLEAFDLPNNWQLHYFASDQQAVTRSWLLTGASVFLAAIGFIFYQMQRTRRISVALKKSEQEEALLRLANDQLAIEIEERRTTERRLKRTQTELERAGRLAALGRLSASVTHELGQPIAAMRNHLAVANIKQSIPEQFTTHIGGLVDRMEGITKQLKFFAQGKQDEFGIVELGEALNATVSLVEPNLTDSGASLKLHLPDQLTQVRGNRLRLEQMMTNVLRNAIDATEDVKKPEIDVHLTSSDTDALISIRDNGHGLGKATLAELQEPFFTSKESGKGMGLGLAISLGIIEDHGGNMSARNAKSDGAVFEISLPLADAIKDEEL